MSECHLYNELCPISQILMMKMTLFFLYHHPSCYKKHAEYKKLPILHETVSYILVGNSSQQLLSWLIIPTTQEGPDYDLRNVLLYTSVSHHLGINYYVNFLRGLGSNEFQLKLRFGTHGN